MSKEGHFFKSETDTEVIPHLLAKYYDGNLHEAIIKTIDRLEGSYAMAIISEHEPEKIVTVRQGSPLIIGKGKHESFLASDIPALYAPALVTSAETYTARPSPPARTIT